MSDEPESLILRSLRRIEAGLDVLREDMREVKTRLALLEQQVALVSTRIDRVELRLDRIERRLDLVEFEAGLTAARLRSSSPKPIR